MNIKFFLFLCVCGSAAADVSLYKAPSNNYTVDIGGAAYFELGSRFQNSNTYNVTVDNKNVGSDSSAAAHLTVKNYTFKNKDVIVGAQVGIATNNISSSQAGSDYWDRTYIWIDNSDHFGYLEYGTNKSAAFTMEINGTTFAVATGGANGSWNKYFNPNTLASNGGAAISSGNFILFPGLIFPDGDFSALHTNEKTRKITYYSPKYEGFQIGVSYIPDATNYGSSAAMPNISQSSNRQPRNGVLFGVTWEKTFAPYKQLTMALIGEYGSLARSAADKANNRHYYNPKAFEFGFNYRHNSFVYGASYGNQWKSEVQKIDADIPDAYFATAGVKYDITDKLRASLSYLYGRKFYNTSHVMGLGGEYNISPGLLPYVDFAYINMNQQYSYSNISYNDPGVATLSRSEAQNSGMAFIAGMKIFF